MNILITGGSKGIGKEVVNLLPAGDRITNFSRAAGVDLLRPRSVVFAIDSLPESSTPVECLILNAGIFLKSPVLNVHTPEKILSCFLTNVLGNYNVLNELYLQNKLAHDCQIFFILTADLLVPRTIEQSMPYLVSKKALEEIAHHFQVFRKDFEIVLFYPELTKTQMYDPALPGTPIPALETAKQIVNLIRRK